MEEKIAEETLELYEMLRANSQQKSARGRRIGVNEVETSNDMTAQLTKLMRQVTLLNSQAQLNNEVYGIYGTFGHGANMCPQNLHEPEQVKFMNANQLRPHFDPYAKTYNPRWRSHPNFS